MRTSLCAALSVVLLALPTRSGAQQDVPPPPQVDDVLLRPVARARVEVGTWEEALRHVRARSTDLRIAAEEIARAEAQSRVALAAALPSINVTAAYTHNMVTNETQQFVRSGASPTGFTTRPVNTPFPDFLIGQVVANQPLLAMRAWYAIGTAEVNEDVARTSIGDVKRKIALAVANAIVTVVTNERIAELNRVALQNALQRLALTERRSALGGATGLDVIQARTDAQTVRTTLVAGDEALRQAREALGLALGVPEQVGVPPSIDIGGLEASARGACRSVNTVDERPDVATLRGRVELAERAHNDVKYQFAPTVDLRSTVATTTVDTGAAPNTTWNVQALLTVPLWEGGARYGNLRETAAQGEIARERLEAQRRQAAIDIARARRGVDVAEERRRVAVTSLELATELDRLTRLAYAEGRGTSLELVQVAQKLRQAQIELALREFDLVQARVLAVMALATCPW